MTPELKTRVTWGLGSAVIVILCILFLGPEVVLLITLGLGLKGWHEYARMMDIKKRPWLYIPGFFLIACMMSHAYFLGPNHFFWIWVLWTVGFFMLYFERLFSTLQQGPGAAVTDIGASWKDFVRFTFGILYIFLIFGFLTPIRAVNQHGVQLLLLCLVVIFGGDTSAYFVGRRYGRRKLWPELSPKKTWEGAIGGLCGSILGALLIWVLFTVCSHLGSISIGSCLILAILGAPLAQAGDFLESLMKRAAGIKDTGGLLPGHGGILDRADGLALVVPMVYYLFT